MSVATDRAVPSFGAGVKFRFDKVRDAWVVLAPERLFLPDEQGVEVLKLVDGARSILAIAGDLAARAGRLVAEGHRAQRDLVRNLAADAVRRGIMVARDPDPVTADLQICDRSAVIAGKTRMRITVVETIPECDDRAGLVVSDHGGEPTQGRYRIERRQQGAARRVARAFFEMQIGDDKQALLIPHQRTGEIDAQREAGDLHRAR